MTRSDHVGVYVVDDHPPFLDAARAVVEATPGFELVGTATSASEAHGRLQRSDDIIDLVLMDIDLGDGNGADVAAEVTKLDRHPTIFLISTMHVDDVGTLPQECGASAYIPKLELSPAELVRCWDHRDGGRP